MGNTSVACCGIDCEQCSVFVATVKDDPELRAKCAREWSKTASEHWGMATLDPESMLCYGCLSERWHYFIGCRKCPIRGCCKDRGLANCGECEGWKECGRLTGLFEDMPEARTNLEKE